MIESFVRGFWCMKIVIKLHNNEKKFLGYFSLYTTLYADKIIESIEFKRTLVEERLKTIINGLTDACRQANAFLWMHHFRQDNLGTFIAENSINNTTILSDCVISKQNGITNDDLNDYIINFIKTKNGNY